jgi:uncharacterized protein YndB with AHSA1/START domain
MSAARTTPPGPLMATTPMADSRAVRVDEFLAHPPARVWRALTDPDLLARWLMPNDFRPEVGHTFTFRTDPRPGGWRSTVMAALRAALDGLP